MFNPAIGGHAPPVRISTDRDPPFHFHRWLANLRIPDVEEIKSVPCDPMSHPFIKRLIETIRHEYLITPASGFRSIFTESSTHSGPVTTAFAFIARSTARRRQNGPDVLRRRAPTSPNITGHRTVAVCSRRRSPLDLEFVPHRVKVPHRCNSRQCEVMKPRASTRSTGRSDVVASIPTQRQL